MTIAYIFLTFIIFYLITVEKKPTYHNWNFDLVVQYSFTYPAYFKESFWNILDNMIPGKNCLNIWKAVTPVSNRNWLFIKSLFGNY